MIWGEVPVQPERHMLLDLIEKQKLRQRLVQSRSRLYGLAYSWTGNPHLADDLVQECHRKALMRLDSLREYEKLEVWLCSILSNAHKDHLRRHREWQELDPDQLAVEDTTLQHQESEEIVQRVRQGVAKLSIDQRHVLTLVDLMGLSYDEVSRSLEIPMGTVMSRLSRARKNLKTHLEKDFGSNENTVTPIRRVK